MLGNCLNLGACFWHIIKIIPLGLPSAHCQELMASNVTQFPAVSLPECVHQKAFNSLQMAMAFFHQIGKKFIVGCVGKVSNADLFQQFQAIT